MLKRDDSYRLFRLCIALFVFVHVAVFSQENPDDIVVTTQRLSQNVLVLSETLMGNNVVAVASEKGIVIIDDTGLPSTASKMRSIIEKTFGRKA